MPSWKKVITSGSNASLSSLFVTNVTASIVSASQFTGSLFGTASLATIANGIYTTNTTTNASHFIVFTEITNGFPSLRTDNTNLLYNPATDTLSSTNFAGTASWATSASQAISASRATTASLALTASYVTGSIFTSANPVLSASYALTASHALNAGPGSTPGGSDTQIQYNSSNTFAGSPNFTFSGSNTVRITGSLFVSGSNNTQLQVGSDLLFVSRSGNVGVGTTTPVGRLQVDLNNIEFININGSGSHIALNNPNTIGNNVITSIISGSRVGKWRTDYTGGNSFISYGTSGYFTWYTNGDFTEGQQKMTLFNNGNVRISNNAGTSTTHRLDVGNGTIGHNDVVELHTLNANIGAANNGVIFDFKPDYYSCFIDYHLFLNSPASASRAGNIKISVPHNYINQDSLYNIPFVENTTEWGTDTSYPTMTTEDVYFKVNYDGGSNNMQLIMYNDNATDTSYINASIKLIKYST